MPAPPFGNPNITKAEVTSDGQLRLEYKGHDIMSYNKSLAKTPFAVPPLSDALVPLIGKIAVTWSHFESAFDDFLQALISVDPIDERKWRFSSFRKRKTLFQKLTKKLFPTNASVRAGVNEILADADNAQWRRNLLLHGKLICTLSVVGGTYYDRRIEAYVEGTIRHKGLFVTQKFDAEKLENLFLEIGHIAGRMDALSNPNSDLPHFSSDDRSQLSNFLRSNHPIHSKQAKSEAPPQSSGA